MVAVSTPSGFSAAYHFGGGVIREQSGFIDPANTTAFYNGDPVAIQSTGYIAKAASGVSVGLIGIFVGCEYTDASGQRQVRNYWTGETGATNIIAYYTADPMIVYEVQADGPVSLANIGEQTTFTASSGSAVTQVSNATLATASLSASTANQFRVVGIRQTPDNAFGDAFTVVQVMISLHQFVNRQGPF